MKRFIHKILVFSLFPILFFGFNMAINYFIYHNEKLDLHTDTLIAGDSHPQKSINPTYFVNAKNISQTAEPLVLTYWKLKKAFKTSIPDNLILGFAPHNIAHFNDLKFSDNRWASEMFRRCYPLQEINTLSHKIAVDYMLYYKTIWKQTGFYPKKHHMTYIGSYTNGNESNINDWKATIERHYQHNKNKSVLSDLSINYLDSIVNLIKKKNVKLTLVSSPVHYRYVQKIPNVVMTKYKELMDKYSKTNIVFDKTNAEYPDSLFLNSDHLNDEGATRFTHELIDFMDKTKNKIPSTNVNNL